MRDMSDAERKKLSHRQPVASELMKSKANKKKTTMPVGSGALVRPLANGQLICPNCHHSDHYSGGWPALEVERGILKSVCDCCGAEVTWIHPADDAKWPNDPN